MFEVSATSALVLLWTDHSIYESPSAQAFLRKVSLNAGKDLCDSLSLAIKEIASKNPELDEDMRLPVEDFANNLDQEVTYRKYAVKQFCTEFLSSAPDAQVIFLGAGLDPKSLDIAEEFPQSKVFDVDRDNMDIKAEITKNIGGPTNLLFCKGDVTAPDKLAATLSRRGWNAHKTTLLVAEGISYYVQKIPFKKTLEKLKTAGGGFIFEYTLPDEDIAPPIVAVVAKEFFQQLQHLIQFPTPLNRYKTKEVANLAKNLGGDLLRTVSPKDMERERTRTNERYQHYDGFIRISFIRF